MRLHSVSHAELHKGSNKLSDIILGGQDGLVNVLGVILGVAVASGDQRIVLAAGLAATFAESVSMAAVAYTSTLTDRDFYAAERKKELWEIDHTPEREKEEIRQIYLKKGFTGELLDKVVATISANKEVWLSEMMSHELHLEPVSRDVPLHSAMVVGISAVVGSLIPLTPFFFLPVVAATPIALVVSALTLFLVGVYKAQATVGRWHKSGLQIMIIGMVSALIGYIIGLLFKAPAVP